VYLLGCTTEPGATDHISLKSSARAARTLQPRSRSGEAWRSMQPLMTAETTSGTEFKHWTTEFKKQVLPRLERPTHPCDDQN
jgi:hypothetical protein